MVDADDGTGGSHSGPVHNILRWLSKHRRKVTLLASITAAAAAVAGALAIHARRRSRRGTAPCSQREDEGNDTGTSEVCIPLKDVLRFKERQWFMEEVEASRQGDANAMLRLAKMYLHGQGCPQNVALAAEWLRKARQVGVYATFDELWAGERRELDQLMKEAAGWSPPSQRPAGAGTPSHGRSAGRAA